MAMVRRLAVILILVGSAWAQQSGPSYQTVSSSSQCVAAPALASSVLFFATVCHVDDGVHPGQLWINSKAQPSAFTQLGAGTGSTPTIAVGTTTTGPAGSLATVQNVGTSLNAVFNFTIPAGNPGPAGQNGQTGATGAQGPAGTMPAGFTCSSVTFGATGATFSGCH